MRLLVDESLVGGLEPRLGRPSSAHADRSPAFRRSPFPACSTISTGSPFRYRWSTRAIMLDKTDATKAPRRASGGNGSPSANRSPRS
jgi:hypothetical protein